MVKQTVALPDIGDFEDVPVAALLVSPGDRVAVDDPIIMIESDKASMEVPAPLAGEVKEILVRLGATISKGAPIMIIETDSTDESNNSASTLYGAAETPTPTAQEAAEPIAPSAIGNQAPNVEAPRQPMISGAVHASPSVRAFARELGVDLLRVKASGPKGRILREDVSGLVKSVMSGGEPSLLGGQTGAGLPAWPKIDFEKYGEIERVSLTRIQKASGGNRTRNWAIIPHVTNFDEADITDLEAFRKSINAEYKDEGVKLTMVGFLIKAAAMALKAYPRFNASLDGEELIFKKYVHVGFAADTPNGLVAPVVRDCDRKGLIDIARDVVALAEKARTGALSPSDMQGGCFSVSSLGGVGGTNFTPIINAPEVGILGAARSAIKPVWDGDAFTPRLIQPLSLSWDHRVVDGVAAAHFLKKICEVLADFRRASL